MPDFSRPSGKYFNNGYCCAESVLLEVSEKFNVQSELIPKIATGFCSGLAKTDSLCGALTGGILGINMLSGRSEPDADRERNYEFIQKLSEYFQSEFGSTNCTGVCGCNISTSEGNEMFQSQNKKELCTSVVEKTSEFVIGMLQDKL